MMRGLTLRTFTMLALTASMVLIIAYALTFSPHTAYAQTVTPEQELAEKFAPVAYLRAQQHACDREGEGYLPAPVEAVLGNSEVVLKQITGSSSASDTIIKVAPTAQDLAGLGEDYYLDFPGNPRRPDCIYETDFKRFAAAQGITPTVYARIVTYEGEQKLILQYWFWWYFNDWNNTHESDWEMIQLVFDTATVSEALTQVPERVGFAQHGGGEAREWDDDGLRREGDHPLVFPGAGSHSTHVGQQLYIGWGENGTGFGCDNTNPPSRRTELDVVLIPEEPDPNGPFGWTYFEGRWGERQNWEFNGPRSPNMSRNWADPLGAMENWRSSSLYIPASRTFGPTATGLFCSLSGGGSRILLMFGSQPPVLVSIFATVVTVVAGVFYLRRRELGTAIAVYRRHLRTIAQFGLVSLPIGIVLNALVLFAIHYTPVEWVMDWFNDTAGARFFAVTTIGVVQQASMMLVIGPPVMVAIKEMRAGRRPSIIECYRTGFRRLKPVAVGLVIVYITTGALLFWVITIPVAIWLSVRWQFYGQAVILDDAPNGLAAIRQSAHVTHGNWWQALTTAVVFQVLASLPGPLIGLFLLLFGRTSVQFANSISSLIYAITVPIAVIGLSMSYERFKERRAPVREPLPEGMAAEPV